MGLLCFVIAAWIFALVPWEANLTMNTLGGTLVMSAVSSWDLSQYQLCGEKYHPNILLGSACALLLDEPINCQKVEL